jgi:hypothetical protein
MSGWKHTPESNAYRLERLREVMRRPRSQEANQKAGVRKAALLGKLSRKRSPEEIERGAAKLRGKKRPAEVVAKVALANRGKNLFRKVTSEHRAALSQAIKESWKRRSPQERERIRQLGLSNRDRKRDPIQGLIHSAKMWGRKRDHEAVEKAAAKMRGRPQTALVTRKGETNKRSQEGVLRSPENITYPFRNITQFVRDNPQLFAPEDLVWKKDRSSDVCRASRGLQALFARKFVRASWKGWTRVSQTEAELNAGEDLLERPKAGNDARYLPLSTTPP